MTLPMTPPPDPAALHAQNLALIAQLADLEAQLDAKRAENERLGSQVVNLQLDCQRRDAEIERLRAANAGYRGNVNYEGLLKERDEARAEVARLQAPQSAAAPWTGDAPCALPHVARQRLPDDRQGRTFKLRIGLDEKLCETCGVPLPGSRVSGHLTVNAYPDGRPGELFLSLDRLRRGDLAATFGHQLAIAISIGLQYGVPLEAFVNRMRHVRDESGGVALREVDGKIVPCEAPHTVGSLVDLIAVTLARFAGGGR